MKKIVAESKVNPAVLALSWLLLILLPAFFIKVGIGSYLKSKFEQNKVRAESRLYSELQCFMQDLDEKSMLNEKLQHFDSQKGFIAYGSNEKQDGLKRLKNLDAKTIRSGLEKEIGCKVFGVFSYSADTQEVDYDINVAIASELKPPSKTMLKRFFSVINQQDSHIPCNEKAYKPALSSRILANEELKKNYSSRFLKLILKTIDEPELEPNKIHETIASKTGKTGNIFLYFAKATATDKKGSYNLGGYLAIFRLQDISEASIYKFALGKRLYSDLNRKAGWIKAKIDEPENFRNKKISRFFGFSDRYGLSTMIPDVAIVRKVQRGTIFPENLKDFSGRVPAIETSISNEKLQHPFQKQLKSLLFFSNLFLLFGTVFAFRIWFFGLNFNAYISSKIFFATLCSCAVPIGAFFLLSIVYQENATIESEEELKKILEARTAYIQKRIQSDIEGFQYKTLLLAQKIEKENSFEPDKIRKILAKWCPENCANGAIFQLLGNFKIEFMLPELEQNKQFLNSWAFKKIFLSSFDEYLLSSPLVSKKSESYSTVLTEGTGNSGSINQNFVSNGKLIATNRTGKNSRVSGMMLKTQKNGKSFPIGFIMVDYSLSKMIDNILRNSFNGLAANDRLESFRLDTSIVRLENETICFSENSSAGSIKRETIANLVNESLRMKKALYKKFKENGVEYFTMVNAHQELPFASVIQGSRTEVQRGFFVNDFYIVYPLLILLAALLFSNLLFVSPAISLSSGLSEIASGNLHKKLELKTGDEFEKLAKEFNAMTKSLIEKEQLEKFVSKDVLDEIEKSTESEMQPGGEKIEASVLFSTFRKKTGNSENIYDSIKHADRFLNICHTICTQNHGVIDKVIGQTIMMVFRGRFNEESHSIRACNTSAQITQAMTQDSSLICHSGISSGVVVSGKIGSKKGKLDYTVIGDTVNMAARLKANAAMRGVSCIIIAENTAKQVSGEMSLNELEPVSIKGKKGEFKTFEIELI